MTFLPVVERELRVASRRRGTYWGRFTAGVIGAVLVALIWTLANEPEKDMGVALLQGVSVIVFFYAAIAGTLVTCDCLSEEKREGTLGLLFLTDLKGHDVVLGKLAATSFNTFYGMLAVLPMLAIPFMLGGVDWAEMLRVVLVSINLLFCFLSLGLFTSAICRKDNRALFLSIVIGLTLLIGGPILSLLRHLPLQATALLSSPATGCYLAFDCNYTTSPHYYFWLNAAATQFYCWIFLGLSCWIVPQSWQDAAIGLRMRSRLADPSVPRAQTRAGLLKINPFLWRVARSGRKPMLVWLALGVLTVLWWGIIRWIGSNFLEPSMDLLLLVASGLVLKAWLAFEASRTFSEDRRSGGLELLLSTPLHEKTIVGGQLAALWRQFGLPTAAVVLTYLTFIALEIQHWSPEDRAFLLRYHVALGIFLAADMVALSWAGMWLGLINRKPNRAALLALTRIVVLPAVLFCVIVPVWAAASPRGGNDSIFSEVFAFWILLGLATDLYFGLTARSRLLAQFRTIVAEGLPGKQPAKENQPTAAVVVEVS